MFTAHLSEEIFENYELTRDAQVTHVPPMSSRRERKAHFRDAYTGWLPTDYRGDIAPESDFGFYVGEEKIGLMSFLNQIAAYAQLDPVTPKDVEQVACELNDLWNERTHTQQRTPTQRRLPTSDRPSATQHPV